jgi:putative glutamine amidotransferase
VRRVRLGAEPAVVGIAARSCWLDGGTLRYMASAALTEALMDGAELLPVILPLTGVNQTLLLDRLDGILLPPGTSNLPPWLYNGEGEDSEDSDPARDSTTLPLIRAAVAAGLPVLGLSLGMLEMNVALGGSLHSRLRDVPGRMEHELSKVEDGPAEHVVRLTGHLARICQATAISVNSAHSQGIDQLAPHLAVEALAPDGTIEAVRVTKGSGFAIGVQWCPTEDYATRNDRLTLFRAFGDACRLWASQRERALIA